MFSFAEFGPVYIDRDGEELTCEPNGLAYYTLTDFGVCDCPSIAFFHAVQVSDYKAEDENGETVELTPEEKSEVNEKIIDSLEENAEIELL